MKLLLILQVVDFERKTADFDTVRKICETLMKLLLILQVVDFERKTTDSTQSEKYARP